MKSFQLLATYIVVWMAFTSCQGTTPADSNGENGIYYWRTTFSLNDYEKEFMDKHNIQKLYIKFFDVTRNWQTDKNDEMVPEATIQFKDSIFTDINVVPTVYITTSAIDVMHFRVNEYAEKIFKRLNAMCRHHGITFKELQLDCDWTKHTQKCFYNLCDEIKQLMDSTQTLSCTIRLHQLTQTPPPVDKGVLMVYNTGNLMDMSTDNSIFSRKDIEPYLRDNRLADYSLPLDVAYPAYGWSLIFNHVEDKDYFIKIARRTDFASCPNIIPIGKNVYEATDVVDISPGGLSPDYVYTGYRIRVERPTAKEILEVKKMIEKQLAGKPHNNILYHLDESQLSHYSDNEINKIYSCN